ncbi:lipase [Allosaccharopolyspora coralli]|uniref:Lipase n=1 Tax=Allosaccharopolyspora coralli TaxID=2665642 RepID=A0A5Q3QHM4_9PSEU|nr:lipase family protein [Allosaccharopolyspora coralli]QGK71015.1 lipase [Allosaccharopolyspora coralli]
MRVSPPRRVGITLLAVAIGAVFATGAPSGASAAERPPFYEPPAELPVADGDVVRAEPSEFFLDPLKTVEVDANVQRVMYKSTDRTGAPIAVTGTVITPHGEWTGAGERPVVGLAPGTQGLADRCAPSIRLAAGTEYEGVTIRALLAKGYTVAITDYDGLGTPDVHTYVNREVTGNAVLDMVRAAQRLPEAGVPDDGPVGLYGYSQGGGATAAAAELAATYAPELDIEGVVAGAVPAELGNVAHHLDGGPYAGLLGFAVVGLAEGYDLDLDRYLNDEGRQYAAELKDGCVEDAVGYPFVQSESVTADGRPITDYLDEAPFRDIVAEQRIGNRTPETPVLLTHSKLDDIIPFDQGETLAADWCARGADVQFAPNLGPTHVGGLVAAFPRSVNWLQDRFAGAGSTPNCGEPAPVDPAIPYDENRPLLEQFPVQPS